MADETTVQAGDEQQAELAGSEAPLKIITITIEADQDKAIGGYVSLGVNGVMKRLLVGHPIDVDEAQAHALKNAHIKFDEVAGEDGRVSAPSATPAPDAAEAAHDKAPPRKRPPAKKPVDKPGATKGNMPEKYKRPGGNPPPAKAPADVDAKGAPAKRARKGKAGPAA
jgi:hypothetical protein